MFHVNSTNSLLANFNKFLGEYLYYMYLLECEGGGPDMMLECEGGGLTWKPTLVRGDRGDRLPHFACKAKFMFVNPTFVLIMTFVLFVIP